MVGVSVGIVATHLLHEGSVDVMFLQHLKEELCLVVCSDCADLILDKHGKKICARCVALATHYYLTEQQWT